MSSIQFLFVFVGISARKSLVTAGMSVNTAAQLEQRYGAQLRQAPFSGASTTRILWRMIKDQLPRCTVSEGLYFLYCINFCITHLVGVVKAWRVSIIITTGFFLLLGNRISKYAMVVLLKLIFVFWLQSIWCFPAVFPSRARSSGQSGLGVSFRLS